MGSTVIPLPVKLIACLLPSTSQPSDRQNNNLEEPDVGRSADVDAPPRSLGVKLTRYRLVFTATILLFGTVKTILTYVGQSIAPTTLDWVAGTFLAVGWVNPCLFPTMLEVLTEVPTMSKLYWIGLYEGSNKCNWFFKVDYAPATGYFAMRVAGAGKNTYILPVVWCRY